MRLFREIGIAITLIGILQKVNIVGSTLDASKSDSSSSESSEGEKIICKSTASTEFAQKISVTCPHVKSLFRTGDSIANLSPEDISIVAALGDSLATGKGLWMDSDVDFRGAAFAIGGDSLEEYMTIPNILSKFNSKLMGESHGMGTIEQLGEYQLNFAEDGAKSTDVLKQAGMLIHRLYGLRGGENGLRLHWILLFIIIGTDQICGGHCSNSCEKTLHATLKMLRKHIPKALVVLIGPLKIEGDDAATQALQERCNCYNGKSLTNNLYESWIAAFEHLQNLFSTQYYPTFGIVTIPILKVTNENPERYFQPRSVLLNRNGQSYAAKWIWNQLINGPVFETLPTNTSSNVISCPSMNCPYFRTSANSDDCKVIKNDEWISVNANRSKSESHVETSRRKAALKQHIVILIIAIISCSFVSVCIFGYIFYMMGRKTSKPRFHNASEEVKN